MMHPARENIVNMYADTLVMGETERVETIKKWEKKQVRKLRNMTMSA